MQIWKKIGVLVNGTWGKKTYEDFKKLNPNTDLFEASKNNLGEYLEKNNFENLDYLHITSNETIEGIQIKDFNIAPKTGKNFWRKTVE